MPALSGWPGVIGDLRPSLLSVEQSTVQLPLLIGRYEILEALPPGGMGQVYRARDPKMGRTVAIKVLKPGLDDDAMRARFSREANAAGRLDHDNIVKVFDVDTCQNRPFIVMQFIEGETLERRITSRATDSLERKLLWMEQLCSGLAEAHDHGIIHRDIKPANLMIQRGCGRLLILDFGIAKVLDAKSTTTGAFAGTLNYMSPEQMQGLPVDHRSDIFSVGAVFYEMLSGRRAFSGKLIDGVFGRIIEQAPPPLRESECCRSLDPDVERIVYRALEKSPERRYQRIAEMQREIARARIRIVAPAMEEPTVVVTRLSRLAAAEGPPCAPQPLARLEPSIAEIVPKSANIRRWFLKPSFAALIALVPILGLSSSVWLPGNAELAPIASLSPIAVGSPETVGTASMIEPGTALVPVSIDTQPWSQVRIRSAKSRTLVAEALTPSVVQLPPGSYTLSFEQGTLRQLREEHITVDAGRARAVSYRLTWFEPDRAAAQLGLERP